MYKAYDEDGNGVLSFAEFCAIIRDTVPGDVPQRKLVKMFKEVVEMDKQGGNHGVGECAQPGVGDDEVSPEAFAHLCRLHSISPTRRFEEMVLDSQIEAQAASYQYDGAVCELPQGVV